MFDFMNERNKTGTKLYINIVALQWWNTLNKNHQNYLEHKIFGVGEFGEDNTLNENDIVHMFEIENDI